ncbi:potassium channel family protein [Paenactinomyces guangxiensis]|uniref:TrkA family potassium uptake protein n=1 Tax=Paenactinomyces guangxiensis TaxID=1490290 RepID=A0A7W1WR53_9BACL|nr:TrkA family potassium uptake protein [Paenactinomyces guangxiensis]MBA4494541.1 TrkA family potassium uptake protein [Paenactinomyces guangxiensis]MBH8591697.1 TrkA family potassium uptake protein [Paenactinomyces guangxiensis]
MSKTFAIIGLGRFGGSVAKTLSSMGYEVLAVDRNPQRVQDISQIVTHAIEADSTDENALKALGIRNFDVIVVAIGDDIQASIMTTLILKEMGVNKIVVKAQSELHGKVLYKIGADRVVFPERDMGIRVVHNLISPNILDYVELSKDYSIVEIIARDFFHGKTLQELDIRARFGCNVMAIKSGEKFNIAPASTDIIHEGDMLVVIGHNDDLKKLQQKADRDG